MNLMFIVRRLLFLVLVVWSASTITFFIPGSRTVILFASVLQHWRVPVVSPSDLEQIVASYNTKFGLDKPLIQQYFDYIASIARFDMGVSLNKYPRTVMQLIGDSLPWTIALLLVTTVLSFVIGNLLGAVAAWPRAPQWIKQLPPRLSFYKAFHLF